MPRSSPMMCRMFSVFTSPACVTNCAEHSRPTNKNSRKGDIICAIDLVRASSRSTSFLEGVSSAWVGWRDSSEVDELNDDGDRDNSSFGAKELFVSFMIAVSSWLCLAQPQGIPSLADWTLFSRVSRDCRQWSLNLACGAMAMFFDVEEMGLCLRLSENCISESSLRERGMATWTSLRLRVRHPHVGPSSVLFVPHNVGSDLRI